MAKTKGLKPYTVCAKVVVETDVVIDAESLEDAIDRSKSLIIQDFIKIKGNYNDGSLTITGAFDNE